MTLAKPETSIALREDVLRLAELGRHWGAVNRMRGLGGLCLLDTVEGENSQKR
ncbi:MAG: hypothetical protein WA639_21990 [Candidatus Acidiferrum sp.]